MSEPRVPRATPASDAHAAPVELAAAEAPLLATALARSFELVAGVALLALLATAVVVVVIPTSASRRAGFAVELVFVGLALVVLALLLSRRSARAVMQPLEVLQRALAAVTAGDLGVHVHLDDAAAEIQFVGESVNAMVRELSRLRAIESERSKDQRVRRELAEVVHASLHRDQVVQRAVEVVGDALEVDRVHIRLFSGGNGRIAAEWRRSDDIAAVASVALVDEANVLVHLVGISDDANAVVIDDTRDVARFSVEQREAFEDLAVRSALKYPVVVGGRIAGALVASEQGTVRFWTDSEVILMEGFAREIGRALDHARAFELQHEMVERLGVLDRAKNDFLSEVLRELRGPLANVLGYIELLTDESDESVTSEQRRMLGIVERNSERLLVLISNLATMSRIEAGAFEPKLGPVDVPSVIRRVCNALASPLADGSLEIGVSVEPGLELVADESQIERALHNVVANAIKFSPGGGRIDLFARSDGDEIVINVRDGGVGIAVDELDQLFTRFFERDRRTATGDTRRRPGSVHREADRRRSQGHRRGDVERRPGKHVHAALSRTPTPEPPAGE